MLKACSYCGRIHDSRVKCPAKKKAAQMYPRDSQASHIRDLARWQKTRDYIKRRDHGVCQLCLRNYGGKDTASLRPYEVDGLSVHHIVKLEDDISKAFDEENLITLCRAHHGMAEDGEIPSALLMKIAKENSL